MVEPNDSWSGIVRETVKLCFFFFRSKRLICSLGKPQLTVRCICTKAGCLFYTSTTRNTQIQPENTTSMLDSLIKFNWVRIRISVQANRRQSRGNQQIRGREGRVFSMESIMSWHCWLLKRWRAGESKPDETIGDY